MILVNNYYLIFKDNTIDGPYSFKEAMQGRKFFEDHGWKVEILKRVIDDKGNEVK